MICLHSWTCKTDFSFFCGYSLLQQGNINDCKLQDCNYCLTCRTAPSSVSVEGDKIMRVYYDQDADIGLIKSKKVVIVGYGSQGHALQPEG